MIKKPSILFSAILLACLGLALNYENIIAAEQIQLTAILPKLQAIHEDAQNLLIKNSELKAKILQGLKDSVEANIKKVKEAKLASLLPSVATQPGAPPPPQTAQPAQQQQQQNENNKNSTTIDYAELEEFNKWVDVNLDYAVKNTQASIEAFKEEAQQSSGNVDYSEQAIKDGIEGVKYWQSAVIFQDKTLKNEKLDGVD